MDIVEIEKANYLWIDVTDPSKEDLVELGRKYELEPSSIRACMEPEHLPKFETIGDTHLLLLRTVDHEAEQASDTVQSLTRKLAVFLKPKLILSIHRKEQPYVTETLGLVRGFPPEKPPSVHDAAVLLLNSAVRTYEREVDSLYARFEAFETEVFGGVESRRLRLKNSYLLKRRVGVMKRMLHLFQEPMTGLEQESGKEARGRYRVLREHARKLLFQLAEIEDGIASLLSLQISIASQVTNEASRRTNEVMRVLTIFSVFFMPLNFLASIYGMNFEHMPELKQTWGYPAVLAVMATTAFLIYLWFRRRGWMH